MSAYRFFVRPLLLLSMTFCHVAFAASAHKVISAADAGAVGDGVTMNTTVIQAAIDRLTAQGGGVIDFPAGRYLTGTIELKNDIVLRLDKDAVLLGSPNAADYRNLDPFLDGLGAPMGHALVVAVNARRVGIEGKGTIDGQGPLLKKGQQPYAIRPFLVRWVRSSGITVRDVKLTNPGAWTMALYHSDDVVIEGVTIRTRGLGLDNNDGIDIDSSQHVRISQCDIDSGDDALVIKSTGGRPSKDIVASHLRLATATNAIKLGTESYGGFADIAVSDVEVTNTGMAGIALYTVDGGALRNVSIKNVTMDGVGTAISIRRGARFKTFRDGDRPQRNPGELRDVSLSHISAKNIQLTGVLINGVPGYPVERVRIDNLSLELPGGGTVADAGLALPEKESAYPEHSMFGKVIPAHAIYIRHARDIQFDQLTTRVLAPDARPQTVQVDAAGVKLGPAANQP